MSLKVLVADKFEKVGLDGLHALGLKVVNQPEAGGSNLLGAMADANPDVLVIRGSKVSKAAIDAAPSLKAIIRAGAGYDTIDTAAAAAKNIPVCNCPGCNAVAVAELVFALLLSLDRRIPDQCRDLLAGKWCKNEYSKARGLKGLTLGVVGVGAIGREVISRAKAFGMNVFAHSLNLTKDRAADLHVRDGGSNRADMLKMLKHCDAVTIHVAANKESEHMANREFFEAMRPGAYFINTSRGSVVDEAALAEAVRTKGIRAGADVYAGEPNAGNADWKSALVELPGFVGTHHVGASTDQAQNAVAHEVVRIVKHFKDAGEWENRVN